MINRGKTKSMLSKRVSLSEADLINDKEDIIKDFKYTYAISSNIPIDKIELVQYTESNGKRSVIYFRKKAHIDG